MTELHRKKTAGDPSVCKCCLSPEREASRCGVQQPEDQALRRPRCGCLRSEDRPGRLRSRQRPVLSEWCGQSSHSLLLLHKQDTSYKDTTTWWCRANQIQVLHSASVSQLNLVLSLRKRLVLLHRENEAGAPVYLGRSDSNE